MRAGAVGIALGSLCFLLAFAGCGGGGGSGNVSVVPPSGTGPASGVPQVSPSPYPNTDGDVLVYGGTLTQSFQTFTEVTAPGSTPAPISTTIQNVTQNVAVRANQSFNGHAGLFDLHSLETDAFTSGLKTTTATTDTFESLPQNGSASQLLDYGSQFVDDAGDSTTTSYEPQVVLDQLPDTPGAQWTNSPAASIQQALAGNANGSAITVQRTVHSDGTYAENTTYPPGYAAPGYTGVGEIQENADGSGTFAFVSNGSPLTIEYSLPVPQLTGAPLITVALFTGLDPTAADPPRSSFQLPTWYGNTPSFYGETDRDLGTLPVPASCGLNAQFPQTATAIAQTIDRTDVILGYTEHQTTTSYVSNGYGALCTTMSDKLTLYYDFNGDQAFVFTQTPPLEIETTNEVLALQTGTSLATTKAAASSIRGRSVDLSAAFRATFQHNVSTLREKRKSALIRAVQQFRMHRGQ